jgi:hypothetical protein
MPVAMITMTILGWVIGHNSSAAFLSFAPAHAIIGALIGFLLGGLALLNQPDPSVVSTRLGLMTGGLVLLFGCLVALSGQAPGFTLAKAIYDSIFYAGAGALGGYIGPLCLVRLNGGDHD